jgi:amyloid beta precursor protein binding protein 1
MVSESYQAIRVGRKGPSHSQAYSQTPNFWIVARAIREFHEQHGQLCLAGALPDMFSDSQSYAALHAVFAAKARADFLEVRGRVGSLNGTGTPVPDDYVRLMCKFPGCERRVSP